MKFWCSRFAGIAALFLFAVPLLADESTVSSDARLGVAAPLTASPQEVISQLEKAGSQGVSSIRVLLSWNRVQPKRGPFNWSEYDKVLAAAKSQNVEVVFVFGPTADWASRAPMTEARADRIWKLPKDWGDWQKYVRAAVTHFKGKVKYWQIWEEFDFNHFRAPSSKIVELVHRTFKTAKQADPNCLLILPEPGGLDLGWVKHLQTTETWNYFDILGLMPYQQAPQSLVIPMTVLQTEILQENPKPVWILGYAQSISPSTQADAENTTAEYLITCLSSGMQKVFLDASAALPSTCSQAPSPICNREAALAQLPPLEPREKVVWDLNEEAHEQGLYNARFHTWPGGNVAETTRSGKRAHKTSPQASSNSLDDRRNDNPWLYFDVDDRFLFCTQGRMPITITVEYLGASAVDQAGFNIYYDAGAQQRFSTWHSLKAGRNEWFTYTFVLPDAWLSNKGGYDFRINTKGSKEEVYISRVEVAPAKQ
jgi:hypothetical protein